MQEWTLPTLVPKTSKTPFYGSIFVAAGIIVATIGLLIINSSLSQDAENLSREIAQKKWEISEVAKDRNVVVTRILQTHTVQPTLNLRWIIANFRDVAAKANVRLKGFNITNDVITTSLIATEGNPNIHPDPASTIVTMMRAYMAENGDGKFTLDPIRVINGDSKSRNTSISLRIVPTSIK